MHLNDLSLKKTSSEKEFTKNMISNKRNSRKRKKGKEGLLKDQKALSSSIDALLFLLFVSVAATILMPSIVADNQYRSSGHISAQHMVTSLTYTVMSTTVDEFGYKLEPIQIEGFDLNLQESPIIGNASRVIFTKDQRHRTLSDLVAEGLVLGLSMQVDDTEKPLNTMTNMHIIEAEKQIQNHLDRTIGQRYNYRLEASWHPVIGYSTQSEIIIGDRAPGNAIKQNARISMPVTYPVTKEDIYSPFNETSIDNAMNSKDPQKELRDIFNISICIASEGCASLITEIMFPYDYLSSMEGDHGSVRREHLVFMYGPEDEDYTNSLMHSLLKSVDYTVSELYGMNTLVSHEDGSIDISSIDSAQYKLFEMNRDLICAHIIEYHSYDIDHTIYMMINTKDNSTRYELAIGCLDAIHSTANSAGAELVLMIW